MLISSSWFPNFEKPVPCADMMISLQYELFVPNFLTFTSLLVDTQLVAFVAVTNKRPWDVNTLLAAATRIISTFIDIWKSYQQPQPQPQQQQQPKCKIKGNSSRGKPVGP